MPEFYWEGFKQGKVQTGYQRSVDKLSLAKSLQQQGIRPKKISLHKKNKNILNANISFFSRVSEKELSLFTKQFSALIQAGLPLVSGLNILAQQQKNIFFKTTLEKIKLDIEEGKNFSSALAVHPKVFSPFFVSMVRAGETGGVLDQVFARLSESLEKSVYLKNKIKSAMYYPMAVLAIATVVVVVLLTKVIPVFENLFKDYGNTKLPWLTQQIIFCSDFLRDYFGIIILFILLCVVLFNVALKRKKLLYVYDFFKFKLPLLGPLVQKIAMTRFCGTTATMIKSGVPIVDTMNIVSKVSVNTFVESEINALTELITQGVTLNNAMKNSKAFPILVSQMVAVGESTGDLDGMLGKVSLFYEDEVNTQINSLTTLLEPALMVFLGAVIGVLVIAMYLPIFKIAGSVSNLQ